MLEEDHRTPDYWQKATEQYLKNRDLQSFLRASQEWDEISTKKKSLPPRPYSIEMRSEIIEIISLYSKLAASMPKDLQLGRGGELIGSSILTLLSLTYDSNPDTSWLNPERETVITEIMGLASGLDIKPHDEDTWQRFFDLTEELVR